MQYSLFILFNLMKFCTYTFSPAYPNPSVLAVLLHSGLFSFSQDSLLSNRPGFDFSGPTSYLRAT